MVAILLQTKTILIIPSRYLFCKITHNRELANSESWLLQGIQGAVLVCPSATLGPCSVCVNWVLLALCLWNKLSCHRWKPALSYKPLLYSICQILKNNFYAMSWTCRNWKFIFFMPHHFLKHANQPELGENYLTFFFWFWIRRQHISLAFNFRKIF